MDSKISVNRFEMALLYNYILRFDTTNEAPSLVMARTTGLYDLMGGTK